MLSAHPLFTRLWTFAGLLVLAGSQAALAEGLDDMLARKAALSGISPRQAMTDYLQGQEWQGEAMSPDMARYLWLKEHGEAIPAALERRLFPSSGSGDASRQGGDTAALATPIGSLPYTDAGSTTGMVNDVPNTAYTNTGLTCAWTGFYSNTQTGNSVDVFYSLELAQQTVLNISLCGSGYDTGLGLFANADGALGNLVAGNDDGCGLQSQILACAVPAGSYFIVVDGYGAGNGAYTLNVLEVADPCDAYTDAITAATAPVTVTGSNVAHSSVWGGTGGDIGFDITLPEGGLWDFDACFAGTSAALDLYLLTASPCEGGTLIASSTTSTCAAPAGVGRLLEMNLAAGTYHLVVGNDGTLEGACEVHVLHSPGRPTQGGPDIMGYAWVNSLDAEGPTYDWVEIQGLGINLNIEGDDQQGAFTLPWAFPFYEGSYTGGLASSNGYISFGTTATTYTNTALPTTTTPNNGIYAFWDDLTTGNASDAASVWSFHDTVNDRFIIEWYQVPQLSGSTLLNTFQIILYPNGTALIQYLDMAEGDIAGASVGTENTTGTIGLQVNRDGEGGLLADQLAISVVPMEGDFTPPLIAHTPLQSVETELQGGYAVNATITDESGVAAARLVYTVNGGAPATVAMSQGQDNLWTALLPHQDMGSTVAYHLEAEDQTEDGNTAVSATWTFSVVSYLWPPQNLIASDGSLLQTAITWLAPVNPGLLAERFGSPAPRDRDEGVQRLMAQGFSKEQALSEWEALFAESSRAFIQYQVYRDGELAGTTTALSFTDNLGHGAQSEQVYTYTVRALFTAGESDPSNSDTGFWTQGQTSGGPDGYGYVWYNSSHENGPAYSWVDISQSGTAVTLTDDSSVGPLDLGFTFPFYTEDENQVFIGSNGFLSFGAGSSSLGNTTLPNSSTPNNLIAGFWDDLYPPAPAQVKYMSDVAGGRFIVSWLAVPHCCNSAGPTETFQIILHSDGRIVVQFASMNGSLTSSTTGIENADGTMGLQYQYNAAGAPVANEVAILFVPPVGPEISHTPLEDVETEIPGTHDVLAEITSAIGVASAQVVYSVDGAPEASVPMSLVGGTTWSGAIPHQGAGSTVVYHIEATDTEDNVRESMSWDFTLVSYHWPPVGLSATDGQINSTVITWQPPVNPGLMARWFGGTTPRGEDEAMAHLMAEHGMDKSQALATWRGLFEQDERVFTEYKLYRDGVLLAQTTALSFTDNFGQGSEADVTYTYTVTAQFTAGESDAATDTGYWTGSPSFGGPDAFGYTWRNTMSPGGPAFEWTDISATGTVVALSDDNFSGPVDLGFTFPFYAEFETQVYIGSNGFLSFGAGNGSLTNQSLPNSSAPNNLIATFWDDLNPGSASSGDVYYLADAENQRFIVQFQDIVAYAGTVPFTFQTILDASGRITMMYEDVDEADLIQSTIGIENADGTIGLSALFDGTGGNITDQMAYIFLPPSSCEPVECTGLEEQEPNEGWNDNNASYNTIQCEQTRCGTIVAAPGDADTDWYLYTHFGGNITVTLDVSDFNGRVTLREQAVDGQIVAEASNLPRCFDEAFSVNDLASGAYYIVVEHTGEADVPEPQSYTVGVVCSGDPCSGHLPIECVGTPEVEPNEGWNASPPNSSYGTITQGQTVCGSTWASAGQRDMDWYHFTQTATDTVTFSCLIDAFDAALFLTDFDPAGSILAEVNSAPACAPETLVFPNLPAGEYYIAIAHSSFDGVPEAQNYALAFGSVAQPEDPCDNYVDVGNFHDIYTVDRPAPSRLHHDGTGCPGGVSSPGLDEVTRLVLAQVTDLQVTLQGEDMADEVILLLGNCAQPAASCGAARDVNGADAGPEVLTIANVPAGDYFLVADFGGEGETHPYVMTIIDMESGQAGLTPVNFALEEAHPNPFNPVTTIAWTQPRLEQATLSIHDLRGALVDEVDLGLRGAGRHEVQWDASRFSSGVYFTTLQTGEFSQTRKVVLMK